MNNEIGRKITSLTLMTIMIAGGMTFAAPFMEPAHAQNANLFVSAENSLFENSFAGPMVIEVIINDPALADIDEAETEPDVTINGKDVRMAQALDGSWYAYIVDDNMALAADSQAVVNGTSLDFGLPCTAASLGTAEVGITFTDADGVYLAVNGTQDRGTAVTSIDQDATTFQDCGSLTTANLIGGPTEAASVYNLNNVVRENKTLTRVTGTVTGTGQIGLDDEAWPVIQAFDFAVDGTVEIKYNAAGGTQQVNLVYLDDADSLAGLALDRTSYPPGAAVHFVITDPQLNIDPTDEDSWTFGTNATAGQTTNRIVVGTDNVSGTTNGTETFYQIFDENGAVTSTTADFVTAINMGNLNFDDNGVLKINPDTQGVGTPVLALQDNEDQVMVNTTAITGLGAISTASLSLSDTVSNGKLQAFSQPLTIVETQANSGIFKNTDEGDKANLLLTTTAKRGTSATIDYNDTAQTILVTQFFADLDMDESSVGGEWNSGEEITVTLTDQDLNLDSLLDEDLDVNNPLITIIPAITIGSPISATGVVTVNETSVNDMGGSDSVDSFSNIVRIGVGPTQTIGSNTGSGSAAGDGGAVWNFTMGATGAEFKDFTNNGTVASSNTDSHAKFIFLNYDLRSFSTDFALVTGETIEFTISDTTKIAGDANEDVSDKISMFNQINATYNDDNNAITGLSVASTAASPFQGIIDITNIDPDDFTDTDSVQVKVNFTDAFDTTANTNYTAVIDFFSFGQTNDGDSASDRFNNAIYRMELEETGDNTGVFGGTIEYIMLNQLNVNQSSTYSGASYIADDLTIIVHEDLTDEDSVRLTYADLGADGVVTPVSDQQEAPSHSGTVSLDSTSYKIADTVTVTLVDADLNTDTEVIDIFTVVDDPGDSADERIGVKDYDTNSKGDPFGSLLFITFDDALWTSNPDNDGTAAASTATTAADCGVGAGVDSGLIDTGFTLVETGTNTGIFTGDFQIPSTYCNSDTTSKSTTGTDLEVNYQDYRDASGEQIEVGDGAGIRANTGSVSLDRTVYPVPWGTTSDFGAGGDIGTSSPSGDSVFAIHATGISGNIDTTGETIGGGDVVVHVRINDPDFDVNPAGQDQIAQKITSDGTDATADRGPLKVTISRGTAEAILATAGADVAANFDIQVSTGAATVTKETAELGPITETAPDSGVFELDLTIRYTDGPASSECPTTDFYQPLLNTSTTATASPDIRFAGAVEASEYCILQGDIITVEYTDPTDASGDPNTVTDSAAFDLRNGVIQSDKSVYIIGGDMILTLIEPDFDRDNDAAETYDLDLIEWDSDAAEITMGDKGNSGTGTGTVTTNAAAFDPEPSDFRETGDSTGIFQIVIEVPESLNSNKLDRGEEIVLEYTDWGPSGADHVGDEDEDVNLTVYTSNFGATVELDQKVYSWTDKVYITVVAPDHNFDSDLIDEIGETSDDPIKVSTRTAKLDLYRLVETGTDTGIFTGEVILTGFDTHDADGDGTTADASGTTSPASGGGPTDGQLKTDDDDGITVSFEFSEDETVVGSALVRWNIGEVQWLEASYPATGTGVVRVVDPDMNLNPESVDNFDVDVWSDSDAGGIDLTVTETNEATGIFEGTVFFTTADESSGHRLRVAEGDTITSEYEDNTLPDPYTTADELDITGTSLIGTIVPPLERAPAANARVVDAFGNSLAEVSVDQQVQITADLANGQDREQAFAYLVQVQDGNGVTVSLAWITGSLSAGQSFSPALSWIPDASGTYTATVFVWESVDNPTALSPPDSVAITVN